MAEFAQTWRVSDTFTRPADTTAYAVGDLVANSVTAGSVVPMTFTPVSRSLGGGGMLRRARLRKTGTGITKASFRLHMYIASPTAANGDNGVWSTDGVANYQGSFDIVVDKVFTDGASGIGVPTNGIEFNYTHQTLYGVLEARGAYTPGNAEVFTVILEVLPN